jgi:hypothetical protein
MGFADAVKVFVRPPLVSRLEKPEIDKTSPKTSLMRLS